MPNNQSQTPFATMHKWKSTTVPSSDAEFNMIFAKVTWRFLRRMFEQACIRSVSHSLRRLTICFGSVWLHFVHLFHRDLYPKQINVCSVKLFALHHKVWLLPTNTGCYACSRVKNRNSFCRLVIEIYVLVKKEFQIFLYEFDRRSQWFQSFPSPFEFKLHFSWRVPRVEFFIPKCVVLLTIFSNKIIRLDDAFHLCYMYLCGTGNLRIQKNGCNKMRYDLNNSVGFSVIVLVFYCP